MFCGLHAQIVQAFEPLKHAVRMQSSWPSIELVPFRKKLVRSIPANLLDYLKKDNLANGWPKPERAQVSEEFIREVNSAFSELPLGLQVAINKKLLGVFFVENLGSSAYTEYVIDNANRPTLGFIVLDVSALNRRANQWATWKENSPFAAAAGFSITAEIASKKTNSRQNAIQYILLHEFGHLLAIGNELLPIWGSPLSQSKISAAMKFFNTSWTVKDQRLSSNYDLIWSSRSKLRYYSDTASKLPANRALAEYKHLISTNFPNLYSATNPYDDFAESFANFVHVVVLKKPWRVNVASPKDSLVLSPCWADSRCAKKRLILEKMLNLKSMNR